MKKCEEKSCNICKNILTKKGKKMAQQTSGENGADEGEIYLGKANSILKELRISYTQNYELVIIGFIYLRR